MGANGKTWRAGRKKDMIQHVKKLKKVDILWRGRRSHNSQEVLEKMLECKGMTTVL